MRFTATRVPLCCLLALAFCSTGSSKEAYLARHPAPSPDGSVIAFSWQGDLWVVSSSGGQARRLTVHPGDDRYPVWSRDGRWLAFASNRQGNYDVFLLPVDASQSPRQLTHASATDVPLDIGPGGRVLFRSRRNDSIRKSWGLYDLSMEGGTPSRSQEFLLQDARLSPSGERMVVVRGNRYTYRSGYVGSANRDLWILESDGSFQKVTSFEGDDDEPSWLDESRLLYRSDRDGRKRLYSLDTRGSTRTLVAGDSDWDIRHPRASLDGSTVAYEAGDRVYVARETGSGAFSRWEVHPISIDVAAGLVSDPVQRKTSSSDAEELAVSPDGNIAAFVLHGEVFLTEIVDKKTQEIHKPPTVQITNSPGREQDLTWSPDGKSLLFSSDADGQFDLYLARPSDEGTAWVDALSFELERLTMDPAEDHSPQFAPDGKTIAFLRGKGNLMLLDRNTGEERALHSHWGGHDFVWAPDGKWIASSFSDQQYNTDVWILPVDGGEPYNVSRHPDADGSPHWSPDGKRLLWVSRRHADTMDVWGVWLRKADHERTPADWLAYWDAEKAAKKKDKEPKDEEKTGKKKSKKRKSDSKRADSEEEGELPEVAIDFEDLWRRAVALSDLPGDEAAPFASKDGKEVFFVATQEDKRDLWKVRWDGKDLESVTSKGASPSQLQLSKDGKTIFYITKKKLARISPDGKAGDPIPYKAKYFVDRAAERSAVFEEAWRALRDWFYDPNFHGEDWDAHRTRYLPLAKIASSDADFQDVMNLMVGELNASHMGYWNARGGGGVTTGWLGIQVRPSQEGGVQIESVLPGSPADRTDVALQAGDRILAVDDVELAPTVNLYSLLADTVGETVRLKVISSEKDADPRVVRIKPVSSSAIGTLMYRDWVRQSAELVDRLSEGRLGYLHVQGMNIPSFEGFERDLYAAGHGKEGLLIDVRSNGGGWTTDYLMAVLNVRRHAHTLPRDGNPNVKGYPQGRLPLSAWTKPALALCNEESFSNAEIFSWAFQSLDRGPLVGVPTHGGVISTGGRRLLNGGWIRLPLRGWYVAGSNVNMENNGAVPDVVVSQPPEEDTNPQRDTQLERAVSLMLEQLAEDPRRGAW